MSWREWSIPLLWFAAVLSVVGQSSPVTLSECVASNFNWSINSLQQTPCLVAAYLESACGTPTQIPAVPLGNHYLGPNTSNADPCRCSSVTYSAISACAGCQNRTFIDWLTWSQNCAPASVPVSLTTFPEPLPSAVVVPSWAFLDITTTNNNFSVVAAQQNASVTSGASSSSTSSATTSGTSISSSLFSSTTAATSPTSTTGNSQSNAGAIAGGVVGGLGFVAIVGLGTLWFCLRRKRNMVHQNIAFDSRALVSGKAMSETTGTTQGVLPFPSQSIYTSDMSLYPSTPLTTTGAFTTIPPSRRSLESVSLSVAQFGGSGGGPQTHANVPVIPRGYTGMPEI